MSETDQQTESVPAEVSPIQKAKPKILLPRQIVLPFGYKIRLKYVDPKDMPPSVLADWEEETGIIRIIKTRTLEEKMEDISHEFGHAWVDWTRHVEKLARKV